MTSSSSHASQLIAAGSYRRRLPPSAAAWILILPMLALFAVSVVYPLLDTIRLSFWDIRGLSKPEFAGLQNYRDLISDPIFRGSVRATLVFAVSATSVSVLMGWVVAMLCAFAPRQTSVFRTMIFASFAISETVSAYVWISIFRADEGGMLNSLISTLRSEPFQYAWLGNETT
ncbi:MAG: sugar ABC transporter permease, partial [Phycisphaerales bacterium]|nr:sugar ABC transporter permease [Phycisphaerales bacterium]